MSLHVVAPPKDEKLFATLGKELIEAADDLGMNMDVEQFLYQWASGTRVMVERDDAGKIVSMAVVAMGKRWSHNDTTATVIKMKGDQDKLLEFVKQIAAGFGATELFVENPLPVQKLKHREYTVIGYELQ